MNAEPSYAHPAEATGRRQSLMFVLRFISRTLKIGGGGGGELMHRLDTGRRIDL